MTGILAFFQDSLERGLWTRKVNLILQQGIFLLEIRALLVLASIILSLKS